MVFKEEDFIPFQDARDIKTLILTSEQYDFLVDRLNFGLKSKREDAGYLTVIRTDGMIEVENIYIAPDEFKYAGRVDFYGLEESEWYRNFIEELKEKKEKIGLYYHTHSSIQEHGKEIHEEGCTARRIRRKEVIESLMDKEERFKSQMGRRLGDLIVEILKGDEIHMHCFAPATEPYYEDHPVHLKQRRETMSVEIKVPSLELSYSSFVP